MAKESGSDSLSAFPVSSTIATVPQSLPHPPTQRFLASQPARRAAIPRRQLQAPRALHLWHLASLDAPTVAAVWSLSFAWMAHVVLPFWVPILLMLAVWTAYIADRMLDARSGLRNSVGHTLRERHLFHWRHRSVFLPVAVIATCLAAWIVFRYMPFLSRERNSLLAAATLAYFTGVHSNSNPAPLQSRFLSKELLVGLLFTCGCALPTWVRSPFWPTLCPLAFFAALAWLNCHAISRWESTAHSHSSGILQAATLLALFGSALAAGVAAAQPRAATLLLAGVASALLLALLDQWRNRISSLTLRAAADLVLLTPVLLAPLAWLTR